MINYNIKYVIVKVNNKGKKNSNNNLISMKIKGILVC